MEISIVRLAVLAVIGILAALLCRSRNTEFGILISIAICLLIIGFILKGFEQLADFLRQLTGNLNLTYVGVLLKLIGIAYVCEFASGLCKDAGYQAVSAQVEMAGRVAMMIVSIPVMTAIIQTIQALLS
ncbi:MAG: SpoIIIAC/SpoIIIAD family protein [Clostridium sp.]|nr:SpoIIIAC/SpoIIIAD family protein [Clostridium sp.]